jgi:hypothetical protein
LMPAPLRTPKAPSTTAFPSNWSPGMGTSIQEDEGGDGIGIGINFYDDNGSSHRFSFQPEVTSDVARPLSPVLEDISNDPTLTATATPKKDVIGQIDDLLTRVYSEQGQSLDRSARKLSVTSTTHSNRSGPRSRDSSRNFSPVVSNSLAYTPSRQPLRGETFASIQRSQSLYSPSTLHREAHSPRTTLRISSATPLEPYRLTSGDNRKQTTGSGFSPSESSPSLSYATYGHRIPGAPNSSPTIVKRSNRNIPSGPQVSTNQQRLSLYFNEEELHLAYLKVEALRENLHCPGHEFCNTCIDTEYATIFTVMMATTFPPEDRATIIKHNRSLRTIKNVSRLISPLHALLTLPRKSRISSRPD